MEEKRCTGDCIRCSFQQQVYCAAQHGHAILAVMPRVVTQLDRIEAALGAFGSPASAGIINPLGGDDAQGGVGAENRTPVTE